MPRIHASASIGICFTANRHTPKAVKVTPISNSKTASAPQRRRGNRLSISPTQHVINIETTTASQSGTSWPKHFTMTITASNAIMHTMTDEPLIERLRDRRIVPATLTLLPILINRNPIALLFALILQFTLSPEALPAPAHDTYRTQQNHHRANCQKR